MTLEEKFPPPRPWTSDERIMKLGHMPTNYSTTPALRLQAVIEAGELIAQIGFQPYAHYELFGGPVPVNLQMAARWALTHFPPPGEILDAVKGEYPIGKWLAIDPLTMDRWLNPGVQWREREPGDDF
ncbi:hypothetical protein LJR175_005964 [Variovorax sp. LjRoot175]|uniref:hypothetical protein n=1 Tax=Variovorax sp. LjRoot175 TaxID=3342276 RepID=UPI003ECC94FF